MKWNLLSEVARKDVDLFVFSEHGAPDTQYINESKVADDLDEDMDYLRRSLAEAYRYYQGKGQGEGFMKEAIEKEYKLSRKDFLTQPWRPTRRLILWNSLLPTSVWMI